jgi:hypothetical protein
VVQWDRAATADPWDAYGIPSLTAGWLQCHYGGSSDLCNELTAAVPNDPRQPFSLVSVGSNGWDTGPFGHVDLYGNAEEWARSSTFVVSDADFCALPDNGPDPSTFASDLQGKAFVRQYGEVFLEPSSHAQVVDTWQRVLFGSYNLPWDAPNSYTGFRCAFPPVP